MEELKIGSGLPLSERVDMREFGMDYSAFQKSREAELEAKLAYRRANWFGTFDTGLTCMCHKPIVDYAMEKNPHHVVSPRDIRFGPPPPIEERIAALHPYHRYWCESCGLTYENTVIEGARGYIPREKRPEYQG